MFKRRKSKPNHDTDNKVNQISREKHGCKENHNNFFTVTSNNKESIGSAKELSKARGEIIMRWLMEQGIDKKRMEVKAWGGKKMIYKKTDSMAGKNVRVEIEILKD